MDIYKDAAEAARQGANKTSELFAKAGRSSYVPVSQQKGVIDPGAEAVALAMEAISNSL
jgi:dihydroxyacetone kinase